MPLMDEFQEQRDKIKAAPLKVKAKYFADYYLKWTLAGLAILIFLVIMIVNLVTKKEEMLYVSFVNFRDRGLVEENVSQVFVQQYVEDPKKQDITLDYNLYILADENTNLTDEEALRKYSFSDQQKLSMLLMAGEVDLMVTGEDVLSRFAENDYVLPLEEVYSEAELQPLKDAGLLLMSKGKAVGICVDGSQLVKDNLEYNGENKDTIKIYAGFCSNKRLEMAKQFLGFLK